ncbi:putative ATP-binding cassette transporter, partial [Bimuria novae-zelandiae CBS 107.79]
ILQHIAVCPSERDLFVREHLEDCYRAASFIAAYTVLEIPFTTFTSLIFGIISAYAIDFKRAPAMIFILVLCAFCVVACGESLGIIFNRFFDHTGFALVLACVVLSLGTIMGGIISLNVPPFLQAWNYMNPIKYMIGCMSGFSMRDRTFTCKSEETIDGKCPIQTGQDVLRLYKLEKRDPILDMVVLIVRCVAYRLLAFGIVGTAAWWKKNLEVRSITRKA